MATVSGPIQEPWLQSLAPPGDTVLIPAPLTVYFISGLMTGLRPAPYSPVPFMGQLLFWLSGLVLWHPEDKAPSQDLPLPLLLRSPPAQSDLSTRSHHMVAVQRCKGGGVGKGFPKGSGHGATCSPEKVFRLYSVGNGEPSLAFWERKHCSLFWGDNSGRHTRFCPMGCHEAVIACAI